MPQTTKTHVSQYRITVEELTHYRIDPLSSDPADTETLYTSTWDVQDSIVTNDKVTFAGTIDAISDRYRAKKGGTFRDA